MAAHRLVDGNILGNDALRLSHQTVLSAVDDFRFSAARERLFKHFPHPLDCPEEVDGGLLRFGDCLRYGLEICSQISSILSRRISDAEAQLPLPPPRL